MNQPDMNNQMQRGMEIKQNRGDASLAVNAISLSLCWLPLSDLGCVSSANKALLEAARESHLWQAVLKEFDASFPLHEKIEFKSILNTGSSQASYPQAKDIRTMRIPPRIHGEIRQYGSCFLLHHNDHVDRQYPDPLLLITKGNCNHFNKVTGDLEDLFHRADDDRYYKEEIWLPREFPCACKACNTVMNTPNDLIEHCTQYKHIWNSTQERYRLPAEWIDPRHEESYEDLSVFGKAKVLWEYRSKVLNFLRAPMDEAGQE